MKTSLLTKQQQQCDNFKEKISLCYCLMNFPQGRALQQGKHFIMGPI